MGAKVTAGPWRADTGWTLADIIRTHGRERAERPVLTYGTRTISYAELQERASRVAQGLCAEGVGPQDRVAFLDKNGPEYFEVLFGGGMANAVNVAVNWRLAPREMEYIINDAEARMLFVGPDFFPHLEQIEKSLGPVRKTVVLGDHPRHESYEAWIGRQPARDPGIPSGDEDVAMQLYTSSVRDQRERHDVVRHQDTVLIEAGSPAGGEPGWRRSHHAPHAGVGGLGREDEDESPAVHSGGGNPPLGVGGDEQDVGS